MRLALTRASQHWWGREGGVAPLATALNSNNCQYLCFGLHDEQPNEHLLHIKRTFIGLCTALCQLRAVT